MVDAIQWPDPPNIPAGDPKADGEKARYQATLDVRKAAFQADLDRAKAEQLADSDTQKAQRAAITDMQKADYANEFTLIQAVENAYLEVAKGQITRTAERGDFVQKAAGAISSAYVAVLAFSFAVGKDATVRLPARGIVPTFFLGLAIVLSTVYVSYLTKPADVVGVASDGTLRGNQTARRQTFILWTRQPALTHVYWLHTAIISLAVGLFMLPLPFLKVGDPKRDVVPDWLELLVLIPVPLVAVFLVPWIVARKQQLQG